MDTTLILCTATLKLDGTFGIDRTEMEVLGIDVGKNVEFYAPFLKTKTKVSRFKGRIDASIEERSLSISDPYSAKEKAEYLWQGWDICWPDQANVLEERLLELALERAHADFNESLRRLNAVRVSIGLTPLPIQPETGVVSR